MQKDSVKQKGTSPASTVSLVVPLSDSKNSQNNKKQCPFHGGKLDLAPAVVFSMGVMVGAMVDCGNSASQHFMVDFLQAVVYFGFD